jgi:hypothetical protein
MVKRIQVIVLSINAARSRERPKGGSCVVAGLGKDPALPGRCSGKMRRLGQDERRDGVGYATCGTWTAMRSRRHMRLIGLKVKIKAKTTHVDALTALPARRDN